MRKLKSQNAHLLEKQIEAHGLKKGEFVLRDDALRELIRYYTREAGRKDSGTRNRQTIPQGVAPHSRR